jgi:lipopolysaccharide/colanic/teichoic acid biosynthesis glycosyltransferase
VSAIEAFAATAPAAAIEPTIIPAAPEVPAWYRPTKRMLDLVIAATVLALTAPLTLVAMAAIVLVAREQPIYRQERVGRNGRRFWMFKLRTMVRNADQRLDEVRHLNEVDGPVFKMRHDPRLHPLGAILRRTSIDELPNLVNVLFGEMSIVGPRPPLPSEVEHYDPSALRRLVVKPGVTCLWQISGRSHLSFEQWMALDNAYIDTWSPLGDIAIILRTIPAVIKGVGAH